MTKASALNARLVCGLAVAIMAAMLAEVRGLSVTDQANLLTYFLTECPTGWTSLSTNDDYAGRVILAARNGGEAGQKQLSPNTAANANPTHTHSTWGLTLNVQPISARPNCSPQVQIAAVSKTYTWNQNTPGTTQSGPTSGVYPSVTLNLCQYTSTSPMYLPPNLVFFRIATQCANIGASQLGNADGRLFVFASSGRSLTSEVVSQAPSLPSGDALGLHSHDLNVNYAFTPRLQSTSAPTASNTCSTGSASALMDFRNNYAWNQASQMSQSGLNIPYVRLITCVSTNTDGSSNPRPHPDAVFFATGNTCPTNFIDVTTRTDSPDPINRSYSNLAGRIVWNRYGTVGTTGVAFGSLSPFPLATSNSVTTTTVPHAHVLTNPNYAFDAGGCNTSPGRLCSNNVVDATQGYALNYTSQNEGNSGQGLIPFRVLRGCSAVGPATSVPSTAPSTSKPSQTPSIAPSTSKPSQTPSNMPTTSKPSQSPSIAPSTSKPSHSPSIAPSTSKPSQTPSIAPSTSKPSQTPSNMPTTSKPSQSPSIAPSTSKPSQTPSNMPTTSKPSHSPSIAPSTSKPSQTPSIAPSTSKPSQSPSKAPSTSKPSASPSKNPMTSTPSQAPSEAPSTPRPSKVPSATPTTSRPSNVPSKAPSTTRPSRAPVTSKPSENPTRRPTARPSSSPTPFFDAACRPQYSLTRAQCTLRIRTCLRKRIRMKWTVGCRGSNGLFVGDGGCQCVGYCGYTCQSSCSADRECVWSQGKCLVRATGLPGTAIPQCKPS